MPSGQKLALRVNSQNPYKSLWNNHIKKCTFHTHPMFYYVLIKNSQGKFQGVSGQKLSLRAKTIWPPMFPYDTWKCGFSQNIVFLRGYVKTGKFLRAKTQKISANAKLLFLKFCKIEMKWMCFCHFWKCDKKTLFHTRCFIMPNCIKKHIFVNLCGGIHRCTFKLASMYYMRPFLIYTL